MSQFSSLKSKMTQQDDDILDEDYEEETEQSAYNPKVRWTIPQRLDGMTFVGKNVLAIVHDIYIIFLDFHSNSETVYVANNERAGDGVDVISGHRSYLFAFAEKSQHARIFVVKYPSLNVLAKLQDKDVNRYKGVCMMENDLIAGFSGFPNYVCTIWSWRTNQRLVCVDTGVIRRKQIYRASLTHMTICECWGRGLIVWEVGTCYKKCFLLRRAKEEVTGWEVSEPPLVDVCWSSEGTLYAIDPVAKLYSVASDGIAMVPTEEWTDDSKETSEATNTPGMCAFGSGLLIYGPGKSIRWLKKEEKCWKLVWSHLLEDTVLSLLSNAACNIAAMWTFRGFAYKVTIDADEKIDIELFTYKMRNIKKIALLAPEYQHLVVINEVGILAMYEVYTAKLVFMKSVRGNDICFETSPVDPLIIIYGEVRVNYGIALYTCKTVDTFKKVGTMCLTHQIISRVVFSPTGRTFVAAAMSAGHIFIIKLEEDYSMNLVRYMEIGRGLADCFLMKVGDSMRCFSLVLVSDKYSIGERVVCVNAETGKDNKFAGKMQGPYARLLPCTVKDTMIGIPHLNKHYHILKLSGDKGVTVSVKMGPIIDSGHGIKYFNAFTHANAFLTFCYDGTVILRQPTAPEDYELKLTVTHRYESEGRGGINETIIDLENQFIIHVGGNQTLACVYLHGDDAVRDQLVHQAPDIKLCFDPEEITIIHKSDKNYLDIQEDKKIHEETMDYARQREEVWRIFQKLQTKLVALLEENIAERPLHQLPLSEFNLHFEAKKERYKQAEKEREIIRLETEALIRAQDKVTAWIKEKCWDTIVTQRVKLFAIFSHYHVENFAILPTQRDKWVELNQIEAFHAIQLEEEDLFTPWEETQSNESQLSIDDQIKAQSSIQEADARSVARSMTVMDDEEGEHGRVRVSSSDAVIGEIHSLSGTVSHLFITIPPYVIPQTLAYSFLHMNWMHHINKLQTQNLRIWFNKQFDELMTLKVREVGLVKERNARLRFIVEELNKLSDLRGSFHHLIVAIEDPEWRQEEQTQKLIKVDPEECSIEPYISPSQIVVIPPDPGPKDDFKERALIEMMDGVLEKLWHEEIKKPIPMPQCMLDKDPEHFNEDDLRLVFEYEKKVAFRNEERDKYRKMLHAEYAKLTAILNDGIVKFNQKVKETWLTKVRIDSVIGQENLILFRLRRTNLDRIEMSEEIEKYRNDIAELERQLEILNNEMTQIQEQNNECLAAYEALMAKDRNLDKTFKSHFMDLSPIIIEQCYKFFKRRPKWHQRATMIPSVLNELAQAVLTGVRPPLLHNDCIDFFKAMEQLDLVSNMPPVMDEQLWSSTCKLRRVKVDNEIRIRALAQELSYVENSYQVWSRAVHARRTALANLHAALLQHRADVELSARNKTIQLVLPAGQVEIITSGHMSDFEDATLIPREDIEKINNLILKVGEMKLRMMRKQMEFRKGILSKEWEHAQMKMKLRHMEQELKSYKRLKIPKELQYYLKNKELGHTDEMDYLRLEREMQSSKNAANKALNSIIQKVEDLEVKIVNLEADLAKVEKLIVKLNVKVSEKRINEDPLEPIRVRRILKGRMETLVARSQLIREVQANHSTIAMLQTELELMRLKTYPTLASFRELP